MAVDGRTVAQRESRRGRRRRRVEASRAGFFPLDGGGPLRGVAAERLKSSKFYAWCRRHQPWFTKLTRVRREGRGGDEWILGLPPNSIVSNVCPRLDVSQPGIKIVGSDKNSLPFSCLESRLLFPFPLSPSAPLPEASFPVSEPVFWASLVFQPPASWRELHDPIHHGVGQCPPPIAVRFVQGCASRTGGSITFSWFCLALPRVRGSMLTDPRTSDHASLN